MILRVKDLLGVLVMEREILLAVAVCSYGGALTRIGIDALFEHTNTTSSNGPIYPDLFSNVLGCFVIGTLVVAKPHFGQKR